jgi:biopolymer transport protein ExbB
MLSEALFKLAHYADQAVLTILALLSVASVGVILQKYFSLRKVTSESQRVRERVRTTLASQSLADVEDIARDNRSVEARAAQHALKHAKVNGSKGLEEVFNAYVQTEKPDLESSLGFLATVGSNAPYIGLFGTVLGIMKAFSDLATATDANQQVVMAGISSALVATALGLFVAIPAVVAYNAFSRQVRGILGSVQSVKELCLAFAKSKET